MADRLRTEIQKDMEALREILEARLNGMEKANGLVHENAVKVPSEVDDKVRHLRELNESQFTAIHHLLRERDTRFTADKQASEQAISAAFQAAEKAAIAQNVANTSAIGKSEVQMREQITALQGQIRSSVEATNDKIANLTGRLDRGEAALAGSANFRSEQRLNVGYIWGIVGGVVGLIMAMVGIAAFVVAMNRSPAPAPITTYSHDWPSAVPTAPGTK